MHETHCSMLSALSLHWGVTILLLALCSQHFAHVGGYDIALSSMLTFGGRFLQQKITEKLIIQQVADPEPFLQGVANFKTIR